MPSTIAAARIATDAEVVGADGGAAYLGDVVRGGVVRRVVARLLDSADRHSGPSFEEVGVHIARAAKAPRHILGLVPIAIDLLHSNSWCSLMGLHIPALVAANVEVGPVVRNLAEAAAAAGSLVADWCFLVDRTSYK